MSVIYLDVNYESCTTIEAKIAKIDAIIDSLLTTALKSVGNGHRVEYSLDDGQTKQRVVYSDLSSVTRAIKDYEAIKSLYKNRLLGGEYRNVDQRNLKPGRYGC